MVELGRIAGARELPAASLLDRAFLDRDPWTGGVQTLVNAILRILVVKDVEAALAAPTGRAAKRLSESTGMEAKTIHRLLEVDPRYGGFKRGTTTPRSATCS